MECVQEAWRKEEEPPANLVREAQADQSITQENLWELWGGREEEDKAREEQAKINKEVAERYKEGVNRERHSEGSGAAPLEPTYEGKELHVRNID